jgi:ribosomal protein S10
MLARYSCLRSPSFVINPERRESYQMDTHKRSLRGDQHRCHHLDTVKNRIHQWEFHTLHQSSLKV